MLDVHLFAAKTKTVFLAISYHERSATSFHKLNDRKSNRPRSDNQHQILGLHLGPFYRVTAYRQRFYQRQLFLFQSIGWVQLTRRNFQVLHHTALRMHTQHV